MRKTRSDAKWLALAPEQLGQIEKWLFEDNLRFNAALERAREQFGFAGSLNALNAYHRRVAREQPWRLMAGAHKDATAINRARGSEKSLRRSGMKLLARQFLECAKTNDTRRGMELGRLLLASEANEIERDNSRQRRKNLDFRYDALTSQEMRWEVSVVAAARKISKELNEFLDKSNRRTRDIPYEDKINWLRWKMWGKLPNDEKPFDPEEFLRKYTIHPLPQQDDQPSSAMEQAETTQPPGADVAPGQDKLG